MKPPSFLAYHAATPEIYEMFEKFTLQLIERGYQHYGAKGVIERIRWETAITGRGDYKIDDRYNCYYARRFEHDHPEHEGFYRHRPAAFLWQYGPIAAAA